MSPSGTRRCFLRDRNAGGYSRRPLSHPGDHRVLLRHDDFEAARAEGRVRTLDVDRVKSGVEQHVALGRTQQGGPHRYERLLVGRPRNECGRADLHATRPEDRELDHEWAPCTTAWPRPRAVSHRLTGKAATK